ncbi:MAG: amidase family protein, partial [Chloroflexota bacterium]
MEWSILDLQNAMIDDRYSSKKITQLYLDRIDSINLKGPTIRAVIEVNPYAVETAEQLDQERAAGQSRGPLHGIPILLKDNVDTGPDLGMQTTAGSLALEGTAAPRDAFITQKLREAGAVILGKANLSEWANFRSSRSSSGWSGRGGQAKNPYALNRSCSGSSSGSGAAVAANLCAAAIGTETDGSIVSPSSANGIVGIKPTVGMVSRSGIIPIAASQDTAGPMARTVADAAILLQAVLGTDVEDQSTINSPAFAFDYTKLLKSDGLS